MPIDLQEAKNDIIHWARTWLSQPRAELGGNSPCPFAAAAMDRGAVDVRLGTMDARFDLMRLADAWDDGYEAVVLVYASDVPIMPFQDAVDYANEHALRPQGLIALEDHPGSPEIIAGLRFNHGTYALIIVQRADKLRRASDMLRARGYYDNWDQSSIEDVVGWRW